MISPYQVPEEFMLVPEAEALASGAIYPPSPEPEGGE